MMNPVSRITTIDYYDQFQCIGSDCELNCCNTWRVNVDDRTLQRYHQIGEAEGIDLVGQIIATDTPDQPNASYIALNPQGLCPLLEPEGLCTMARNYGEEALSLTCQSFPRYGTCIQDRGAYHLTMTLGCPEATRKAIFRTAPLTLKEVPVESNRHLDTPDYRLADLSNQPDALLTISSGLNQLVQQREVPISRRLTTLLQLCAEMDRLDIRNDEAAANRMMAEIQSRLENQQSQTPELSSDHARQLDLFSCLLSIIRDLCQANSQMPFYRTFAAVIERSLRGLGIDNPEQLTQHQISHYSESVERYLKPYLETQPALTENIFASQLIQPLYLFSNPTPVTDSLQNFFRICANHLIITGLATGIAADQHGLSDQDMAELIYLTHRLAEKNPAVEAIYYQLAQALGYSKADQMHCLFI